MNVRKKYPKKSNCLRTIPSAVGTPLVGRFVSLIVDAENRFSEKNRKASVTFFQYLASEITSVLYLYGQLTKESVLIPIPNQSSIFVGSLKAPQRTIRTPPSPSSSPP